MVTDLTIIEAGVWTVTKDTPVDQVADVLGKIEWMIRRAKEVKDELENRMAEIIQTHGEFVIGEVRYYLGHPKSVKSRDNAKTLGTVMEAAEGDLDIVAGCLSSDAFKYGAVRVLLEDAGRGAEYETLFETTTRPKLLEGKPVKRLMKHNPAFAG